MSQYVIKKLGESKKVYTVKRPIRYNKHQAYLLTSTICQTYVQYKPYCNIWISILQKDNLFIVTKGIKTYICPNCAGYQMLKEQKHTLTVACITNDV